MLAAKDISLRLNDQAILTGITCQLNPGEFNVLIGPNGAGKSSLLKVMAGAISPTHGQVRLNGRELNRLSITKLSQYRAVLSQSVYLGFPLTVSEVVALGLQQKNTYPKERMLIEGALEKTQMIKLADRSFLQCSGGEQARAQMARVLVQLWSSAPFPRQFLFLDEPTAALDIKYQLGLLNICRDLAKQGLAILCIMHDLQLSAHYADQLIVMADGKIVQSGCPENVLKTKLISDVYDISTCLAPHPINRKPMVMVSPG